MSTEKLKKFDCISVLGYSVNLDNSLAKLMISPFAMDDLVFRLPSIKTPRYLAMLFLTFVAPS